MIRLVKVIKIMREREGEREERERERECEKNFLPLICIFERVGPRIYF